MCILRTILCQKKIRKYRDVHSRANIRLRDLVLKEKKMYGLCPTVKNAGQNETSCKVGVY